MQPDLERRAVAELRADHTRITGHAIVFNARSRDLGGFVEIVAPTAVDRALRAESSVVALFNHDSNQVLGRQPGTLTLATDTRGLAFTLDPANTTAGRDAFELVRRGDVTGASFGFKTVKDAWTHDGPVTVRTLLDIEIFEISLTALPVYPQTDVRVALRSLANSGHYPQTDIRPSIVRLQQQLRVR